jgi:hypothetical protein
MKYIGILDCSTRLKKLFKNFLFFLMLFSCKLNSDSDYNIIGKWATIDYDLEYGEVMIDSTKVYPCMYMMGLSGPINYILRNDSIIYTEEDYSYSAQLVWISKDEVVWISKDYVDTFYRLPSDAVNFHEIIEMGDSIKEQFKIDFTERRNRMLIQKGDTANLRISCFLEDVPMTCEDFIKFRNNKNK